MTNGVDVLPQPGLDIGQGITNAVESWSQKVNGVKASFGKWWDDDKNKARTYFAAATVVGMGSSVALDSYNCFMTGGLYGCTWTWYLLNDYKMAGVKDPVFGTTDKGAVPLLATCLALSFIMANRLGIDTHVLEWPVLGVSSFSTHKAIYAVIDNSRVK